MEKISIGNWELSALVIMSFCTKIFLNYPRVMSESAGSAGWILSAYTSLLAFVIFTFMLRLYKKNYGMDLIDLGELIGGAPGRIITGVVIISFLIYFIPVNLREFSENMKIISLVISPISFVTLFFLGTMILAAYFGLEAITRVNAIAVPVISAGFILILVLVGQLYDFSKLMPWFGTGLQEIFIGGLPKLSYFSEIIIFFMLPPFLKKFNNFRKSSYIGFVFAGSFLFLSTLVFLLVFEYPTSTESFLPIFQLSRLINYGRFLQRGESVFLIMWSFAAMLYLSFGFFMLLYTFKKTLKLEYYKPLIMPFAVIIFSLSLTPPNLMSAIKLDTVYFLNWGWLISFAFTTLVFIAAGIKKRKGKKE